MTHTRSVYHTIHDGNGDPWPDFTVHFQLTPAVYQMHASLPESVVTVVTDNAGQYSVELETGVQYRMLMYSAFQQVGSVRRYGDKNIVDLVVPHGTVPIALDTVLALNTAPDPDPDLAALANNHIGRNDNPHSVTASQLPDLDTEISASPDVAANTLARHTHANKATLDNVTAAYTTAEQSKLSGIAPGATANATDAQLRDRTTHTGVQEISTVSGLQGALDGKAAAAHTHPESEITGLVADLAGKVPTTRTVNGKPLSADVTLAKADVGLGNVDNTSDASKPISTATQSALNAKADASALSAHTGNTSNPHSVTAAQVGAPTTAAMTSALALKQDASAELTAIAGIAASNDDLIQRKSGAWTKRTPAQLKSDLALAKGDVGLANVTNDAQVTLGTDQTVSGVKTFSGGADPVLGASIAPAIDLWTPTGDATYGAGKWTTGPGAWTLSCSVTVTSGALYQAEWPGAGVYSGDGTVTLGAVTLSGYRYYRAIGIVAGATGTLTLTLSFTGGTDITALNVRPVTRARAGIATGGRDVLITRNSVGIGVSALANLTTGTYNNALGYQAQQNLTTGNSNNALGYQAQQSITTGGHNNALGQQAQQSITTGYGNNALGCQTQQSITTGYNNNALGYQAQQSITTGYNNNALGYLAQQSITTGYNNNALGYQAQQNLTTGNSNNALGNNAQNSPSGNSAWATTTASHQVSIGHQSGQGSATQVDGIITIGYRSLSTYAYGVAVGYQANAAHNDSIALGYNSVTTADKQVQLGTRHVEIKEMSDPGNGGADTARLYTRDNGSGKTQLCVVFSSGAVQVLATQP